MPDNSPDASLRGKNRFECRSCPYQYVLDRRYYERKAMKRKEVEDVLGGKDAWENVDQTDVQCPNQGCGGDRAYFYQIQIRSADEPMTSFFKVGFTFRRGEGAVGLLANMWSYSVPSARSSGESRGDNREGRTKVKRSSGRFSEFYCIATAEQAYRRHGTAFDRLSNPCFWGDTKHRRSVIFLFLWGRIDRQFRHRRWNDNPNLMHRRELDGATKIVNAYLKITQARARWSDREMFEQ